MEKVKVFVSTYACEPGKGSEIGVGWHWVLEMSKYFELWVLTRANNKEPIERYLFQYPEDDHGIHWIYYDCPDCIKKFKHQMHGVRIYYTLWQYGSNKLIKQMMEKNNIEIFHLLTYGNAIWHVSKYGQSKIFIWGPTGGTDTIPREFSKHYAFKHRIVEAVRRAVVRSLKWNVSFHKKCKNADLIFCKAKTTLNIIPKKYRNKAMIFTDVAMESAPIGFVPTIKPYGSPLTYITVGRLDGWRGFDLLIEAFAEVVKEAPEITLKIIGTGSEEVHLKQLIHNMGLDSQVIMTGQISMEEYKKEMQQCDAVLNACLKEGGVTNAFDCMTWGKPLLCVDTGGYTTNFDEKCAIILPRVHRQELIENLKRGMLRLKSEEVRTSMANEMLKKGADITWKIKGLHIYNEINRICQQKGE